MADASESVVSTQPNLVAAAQAQAERVAQLEAQVADLKRRLIDSQKQSSVGALAASITHEFNNILMTVLNYAKMGLRHKDEPTRDKAFDRILAAGQRASKITTGMLGYARARSDARDAIEVATLVKDVLVLVEKDLQMHRVRLDTNFFGDPWVSVNSGQIQQVLINLIINARQAMTNGGLLVVTVKTNETDNLAEISLRDTGGGIPPQVLARIFDPQFSTKTADEHGQGGSGIGLTLCKEIIEAHRGRIRVESVPGQGTTFTLKLPRIAAPMLTTRASA